MSRSRSSPTRTGPLVAYVFKTLADPYTGRVNLFRVYRGTLGSDSHAVNVTRGQKERIGQLGQPLGGKLMPAAELGAGDIGAVAKLKETRAGDVLCAGPEEVAFAPLDLPNPVMAFAYEPKSKGDEEKAAAAVRRLTEEDPTLDVHRDAADGRADHRRPDPGPRRGDRRPDEAPLRGRDRAAPAARALPGVDPPARASAHARYKKQSGGRGQFADCQIEIEPAEDGVGLDFVNQIKGASIPGGFIPAVEKGVEEAMAHGTVAGYPVKGVRVRLVDGKHHDVDSSEMAFKIAGAMAFKEAMEEADPVLLEPIVRLLVSCPGDVVGDVIGDLNSRRGHPLGMEPKGSMTEVRAEVPMAEVLDYTPHLRSISGGRADFELEFDHYEEVPAHLAEKVVTAA